MIKTSNKYWTLGISLALALAAIAVYWPVSSYKFVGYDDFRYVEDNEFVKAGLNWQGIIWAFTTNAESNWHPLTWLSHMLDCQLFGLDVGWHHLTNLLLHIANTLLLFIVFKKMTAALWQSAFVAAAFALHPLHVESVAWIAEHKDVLSTLFWLLTMAAYVSYVKRPAISRYLLTLLLFAMGLMAKPMLVTLPFVLLLLDYWPLQRFENIGKPLYRLIREKIPLFVITAISSVITFFVQRSGGSVASTTQAPVNLRIFNAFISYFTYIKKTIWPNRLAVFYPHPLGELSIMKIVVAIFFVTIICVLVIRFGSRYKYLPVGWLWYLGTLVPVIGLVQVGEQAMADRYTYVPLIGIFVVIACGCGDILANFKYKKHALTMLSLIVLVTWSICTRLQLSHWRDAASLFGHALKVTKNNPVAHNMMARSLYMQGRLDEGLVHNYQAIRIQPYYANAHNNLGLTLTLKGRVDEAIKHFSKAVEIKPYFIEAHSNLGQALYHKGKLKQAVARYTDAVTLNPDSPKLRYQFAKILAESDKVDETVTQLKKVLQLQPNNAAIMSDLAWFLAVYKDAKFHDPKQALSLALAACAITKNQDFKKLDNLATAYAADGRFADAVAAAEKALQLARSKGEEEAFEPIQGRLDLFKSGQPYVEKLP